MNVVVAGGTGFIGKKLVQSLLEQGHQVTVLTRRSDAFKSNTSSGLYVEWWDAENPGAWSARLEGADAVINLTGEGIAEKRWSKAQKVKLLTSRVMSTRILVHAIAKTQSKPKTLINASAVGYYGSVPEGDVTESTGKGKGFLAEVCAEWEKEALKASAMGVRVVLMRIGIVLEKNGGALQKFVPPFQMFVGGPLGSGKQWFPWIHRDDVIGAIIHAMTHTELSGPVNTVSPNPLTMKEFCAFFGRAIGRPSWAPVPSFALKILLGEMSEMLVGGQKAIPTQLSRTGYAFKYPTADRALEAIFHSN